MDHSGRVHLIESFIGQIFLHDAANLPSAIQPHNTGKVSSD